MKIALILMPWYRRESPSPDIAMTMAILKRENHEVVLWDVNALLFGSTFTGRRYWKYFLLDADSETIENFQQETNDFFEYYSTEILSHNPEIIIFKCIGKTYYNSLRLAQIIKENDKNNTIILSGLLPSVDEEVRLLVEHQTKISADFIICGEDEFALTAVLKAIETGTTVNLESIFDKTGKVINCMRGPIVEDLDNLPFFDYSDFDLNSYRFPHVLEMFISRGCPWRCVFCLDWKNEKYRSMSGERIFKELIYQTKAHKEVRHFRFCDKTINGNIKALTDFCNLISSAISKGIISRENEWGWSGDAIIRPEMTKELLRKMSEARCAGIGYGLESASEKVIKDMGKLFSIALAERVIRDTHLANIRTSINILVGFPTETRKDFEDTLGFIKRNKEFLDEIRLTYSGCRIYPHSYISSHLDKYNVVYPSCEKADLSSVDSGIFKMDYWMSKDGMNTYEERIRRTEEICQLISSLGIELRVNSRTTRKAKLNQGVNQGV